MYRKEPTSPSGVGRVCHGASGICGDQAKEPSLPEQKNKKYKYRTPKQGQNNAKKQKEKLQKKTRTKNSTNK